jgi:GT2 family glycosyltransferase
MKNFAIIIINYNCYKDTLETISSLMKFNQNLFDIYLVDNFSSTEDLKNLEKNLPNLINFIKSDRNLGFAGANNLAIKVALKKDYKYIFILNPDTLIEDKNFFQIIEDEILSSGADIIGPLVRYFPEVDKIYFAGGFVNKCLGLTQMYGKGKYISQYKNKNNIECDFITGCSMVVRREVFQGIGLFPEEYFLYFEESDFCMNAKRNNFKIIFTPKTYIFHKVSSSIKYMSDLYLFYMVRNIKIFANKYVPIYYKIFFYIFYYLYWVPGYILISIFKNKNLSGIKSILNALK